MALGALLALAGCGGTDGDPIAWWRQLEGGRLAEARPAPPNADAPYPNLSTVPSRPAVTEAATRAGIAAGLETDRRDAAYTAAQPITPPRAAAGARPAAAPEPAPGGMGASMGAATAAPAPPAPRASAAPPPPAAAAVSPPAPVPAPIPAPVAAPAPPPAPASFAALPAGPPPPPRLPGVAGITTPAPAPRAPPPPPPPPAAFQPGEPARIAFAPGSAILPEGAAATLRRLAASRAGRDIAVAGYGESPGTDAATQSAALPLAFARARAMAAVLAQSGVPATALRVAAEAIGRGGVARVAE